MNKRSIKENSPLKEILLYGVFGAATTILNIGLFYLLANIFNLHYLLANAIAWIIAVSFSFLTNKYYVFDSKSFEKNVLLKETIEFFGSRGFSCSIDMGGMFLLVSILGIHKNYAKLIITLIVIIVNYILSKYWIFKK